MSTRLDPTWIELFARAFPQPAKGPPPRSKHVRGVIAAAKALKVPTAALRKWLSDGCPGERGFDVWALIEWRQEHAKQTGKEPQTLPEGDCPQYVADRDEVAAMFGVHPQTLGKWLRRGAPAPQGFDIAAIRRWALDHRPADLIDCKAREVCQSLSDAAEAILKREPRLSDLDADLVSLLLMGCRRRGMTIRNARIRLERLEGIAELATRRFGHPPIKFDESPLARRLRFDTQDLEPTETVIADPRKASIGELHKMPLTEVLEHYIRERLVSGSKDTVRLMKVAVRSYSLYLGRIARLSDLHQDAVLDYLHHLIASEKHALASIQTHRERLLALWRFAARKRWLVEFPEIPSVRVPNRVPDSWSREEMFAMVQAAKSMDGELRETGIPFSLWWEAIFNVVFDTAERIGAVMALRFDDLTADGWITASAETRKGKTRDKRFKLRPHTLQLIAEMKAKRNSKGGAIFVWPYSQTYVYRVLNSILDDAGLPSNRRNKFHKWRRTSASMFEAAGGDATELLDHSSRSTTKKYLDPRVIHRAQPADLVPGLTTNKTGE